MESFYLILIILFISIIFQCEYKKILVEYFRHRVEFKSK